VARHTAVRRRVLPISRIGYASVVDVTASIVCGALSLKSVQFPIQPEVVACSSPMVSTLAVTALNAGLGFALHKTASQDLFAPGGGECVGDYFPLSCRAVHPMMLAHARTLTFVTGRIPTSRCAFFLLSIRLNDINLAELLETLSDQRIKPGLRSFPEAALLVPFGIGPTLAPDPSSVGDPIRQTHPEPMSRPLPQQDRNLLLIPNAPESIGRTVVQAEPF